MERRRLEEIRNGRVAYAQCGGWKRRDPPEELERFPFSIAWFIYSSPAPRQPRRRRPLRDTSFELLSLLLAPKLEKLKRSLQFFPTEKLPISQVTCSGEKLVDQFPEFPRSAPNRFAKTDKSFT